MCALAGSQPFKTIVISVLIVYATCTIPKIAQNVQASRKNVKNHKKCSMFDTNCCYCDQFPIRTFEPLGGVEGVGGAILSHQMMWHTLDQYVRHYRH